MRRISVTALLVVCPLICVVPAAVAEVPPPTSESTVALWDGALPEGVTTVQATCDDDQRIVGEPAPLAAEMLRTPEEFQNQAVSGLHRVALWMTPGAGAVPGFEVTRDSVLDFASAGATTYDSDHATPDLHVALDVQASDGEWHLSAAGYVTGSTPNWSHRDTRGADYSWTDGEESATGDLSEFVAAHGDGSTTGHLWLARCPIEAGSHVGPIAADGLKLGGDSVTTYDFEQRPQTFLVTGPEYEPGKVRRTMECFFDWYAFDPVVGAQVALEARAHGETIFRQVGVAKVDEYGYAHFHLRPRVTTTYRCRSDGGTLPDGDLYPAWTSAPQLTGIPTHLTVHARRIDHGRRVLVVGTADPHHPGTRVTVWANRIGHSDERHVVRRGRLSPTSTYALRGRLAPGTWELTVWVAAAPGNAAGPSVRRYVK